MTPSPLQSVIFDHIGDNLASLSPQHKCTTWRLLCLAVWWHVPAVMGEDVIDLVYLMVKTSAQGGDRGRRREGGGMYKWTGWIEGWGGWIQRVAAVKDRGLCVWHCNIVFALLPYKPNSLQTGLDSVKWLRISWDRPPPGPTAAPGRLIAVLTQQHLLFGRLKKNGTIRLIPVQRLTLEWCKIINQSVLQMRGGLDELHIRTFVSK